VIKPMSSLKQVRALSKGTQADCLANNKQAVAAVKKDDITHDFKGNKFSNFEMAASGGIRDVPAGTNYEVNIGSYDGTTAKGSVIYEGDYGTYNYTIQKLSGHGEWRFISMTACSDKG
jgi:hypothetical protein